jgi:hypothetical protein
MKRSCGLAIKTGKSCSYLAPASMPPKEVGHVELSAGGHGWISFSLDGRYAWCHTSDVIEPRTRQIVATLKDEHGTPVSGSKFLEIHFATAKVVAMGDQFGLGRR